MNLLDSVVVLVDDILAADLVRATVSGMAIDIRNNTAKPSPPKNKQGQLQVIGDNHAPFLLLQMIAILYWKTYYTIYRCLEFGSESSFGEDDWGGDRVAGE